MNRDQIYLCQDAGLCYICGQEVKNGQAYYSIRGSHYDCEFPDGQDVPEPDREPKPHRIDGPPRAAWANGGSLLHWVDPWSHRALCGHKPADTARHMRTRGKWRFIRDGADLTGRKWCTKCQQRREAQPDEPA